MGNQSGCAAELRRAESEHGAAAVVNVNRRVRVNRCDLLCAANGRRKAVVLNRWVIEADCRNDDCVHGSHSCGGCRLRLCRLRLCDLYIGYGLGQQYSKAVFVAEKWPICGVTVGLAIG